MPGVPGVYHMKTEGLTFAHQFRKCRVENNTNKKPRLVAGSNLIDIFQLVLLPLSGMLSIAATWSYLILCSCDIVYPL